MNTPNKNTAARNRDFITKCREIMAENPSLRIADVLTIAINRSPERYYIDYNKAMGIMHSMMTGKNGNPYKGTLKRDLAIELFETTMRLMRARNFPLSKALVWVLMYRRPSGFYISYQTAYRIARSYFSNQCNERIG